ncbi:MAG: tRNA pseudouridine(55) synthase TruB [Candidatus Omnitrophota bacterium]|nr:MAG: tRNA pseudouridine(55) synthase TruB [Candidatus Omnitrophota bacterium]
MGADRSSKEGIMLVDKPRGMTSHDVVDFVRRRLQMKQVGHAGTLDPLAEGLLIILVGKSTKLFSRFVNFDKEYIGVLKFGETTTTGDSQGTVCESKEYDGLSEEQIREVFTYFEGEIAQVPPMVSALRIKGERLYRLARKGIVVKRDPRKVKIYSLKIQDVSLPFVKFYIRCSKGTYVRKVAEDIGERLGCGAHIVKIKRLSVGPFKLNNALKLEEIDNSQLRSFVFH